MGGPQVESWPSDGLERVPKCPVCASDRREPLYEGLRDFTFGAPGEWSMHRCLSCRSAFLDPRPTVETLWQAYRNYYTHRPPQDVGHGLSMASLRHALANGYRNWRYQTRMLPALRVGVFVALVAPKARAAADVSLRFLPRPVPGGRVLDIGFGDGAFLERARTAGWEVCGVDVDPVVVASARERGLNVVRGELVAPDFPPASFDWITASHVLEHVHSPAELVRAMFRLLRSGGGIYIDTPNLESVGHRLFAMDWRGLEPPRHLTVLGWTALRGMLAEAGFVRLRRIARPDIPLLYDESSRIRAARLSGDNRERLSRVGRRLADVAGRATVARAEFMTVVAHKG